MMFKVTKSHHNITDAVLVSLLLTWNICHTFFLCFCRWIWIGKYQQGFIDLLAGSDLLASWSFGELQNELPCSKENLSLLLCVKKLESCDLFFIFATFFRFLVVGEHRTLKSPTLPKGTLWLCPESSSRSILLYFESRLDSIRGLDTRFSAEIGWAMVEVGIDLDMRSVSTENDILVKSRCIF